ncbi:MAG: hypothetical protein ACRCYE_01595 [Sarcina sp.]
MKKSLFITLVVGTIVGTGIIAEAMGDASLARIAPGQNSDRGSVVSTVGYSKVAAYGKSNGGHGAQNVSFKLYANGTSQVFKQGPVYVGNDLNDFYANNITKVQSHVYHSSGSHNGAMVQSRGK